MVVVVLLFSWPLIRLNRSLTDVKNTAEVYYNAYRTDRKMYEARYAAIEKHIKSCPVRYREEDKLPKG
jgi:hypothetical protein